MRWWSAERLLPVTVGLLLGLAVIAALAEPPSEPQTSVDIFVLQGLEVVLWVQNQPGVRYVFQAERGQYTRSTRSYELSGEVFGFRESAGEQDLSVWAPGAVVDRNDVVQLASACIKSEEGNWGEFQGVTIEPGRAIRAVQVVRFDAQGVSASGRDFLADERLSRFRIAQPDAQYRSGRGQEGDNGQATCGGLGVAESGAGSSGG